MIPFKIIELALQLLILLLEGIPPAQRAAQAVIWFWMWWPVAKLWPDVRKNEKQILELMQQRIPLPANNQPVEGGN